MTIRANAAAAALWALPERTDLVLRLTRLLHVTGQSTDETIAAAERLSNYLGLRATIIPRLEELELRATDETASLVSMEAGYPAGVDMDRVVSAMGAIDDVVTGRLAPATLRETINTIAQAQPAPT